MGLDIGTTGTKAVAFNEDGNIISTSYKEYDLLPSKHSGIFEFDNNLIKNAVLEVIEKSAGKIKYKDPVEAIGASVLGSYTFPINKK